MTVRRGMAALLLSITLAGSLAFAPQIWVGGGGGGGYGRNRYPPRWAQESDFDGQWLFCRGYYNSVVRLPSGSGWNTDYPGADNNFSVRLMELTKISVKLDPDRQPHHVVVRLDDPLLYRCGMIFMTDIGTAEFTDDEVAALRQYILKGGFIWVDDTWGSYAWSSWVEQISRVMPPNEYPIVDIDPSHAIMHMVYDVKAIPQVPSISHWRRTRGGTSEQDDDSREVYVKSINDTHGNVMVLMTHNTDISDTWEREGEEPRTYFDLFSPTGYAIGVNVVTYAMTH
jgi:hypothetical protein